MMRQLFILLLAMLALPAAAQTFYEVSFTDPDDGEEYTGLMIYYDDENCKMRLVTAELLERDEVYESRYTAAIADKENSDDVGVMAYVPEEEGFPVFLWMWERDDASDISTTPYCTFDVENEDSYFECAYFTEISLSDMDEEYVAQFYSEAEAEYQVLLRGKNRVTENAQQIRLQSQPAASASQKTTFHLIVAANTEVGDIGLACQRDLENLRSEFSAIARVLGMDYDEQVIAAETFSKPNLVKAVRGVTPGSDDVLMFVYTGHGFRFDNQLDYYPNIALTTSSYDDITQHYASMSDIYDELTKKGARLTIVLSDCCNTPIGLNAPMLCSNSLFSRANTNFDLDKLQRLFLGESGTVRGTASSPGEVSWCGFNGGYFILSFIESLRAQISPLQDTAPSWETLMGNTVASARKKTNNNASTKTQNGMQYVETKSVAYQSLRPAEEPNTMPGPGGNTLDF